MLFFGLFNGELGGTMHRDVEAPCPYPCKPRDRLSRHGHGQSLGTHSSPAASTLDDSQRTTSRTQNGINTVRVLLFYLLVLSYGGCGSG